jgi:hypothetical protein
MLNLNLSVSSTWAGSEYMNKMWTWRNMELQYGNKNIKLIVPPFEGKQARKPIPSL